MGRRTDHGAPGGLHLLAVAALLAAPQAAAGWLASESRALSTASAASSLVVYAALALAALLHYFYWRILDGDPTAFLVAGLALVSVQGLSWSALIAAGEASLSDPGWLLVVDFLTCGLLLAMAWAAQRTSLRLDPLVAGVSAGCVLSLLRAVLTEFAPPLVLEPPTLVAVVLLLVLLQLAVAVAVLRLELGPAWAPRLLSGATALISLGHALHYAQGRTPELLAMVTATCGAALLVAVASTLLRLAIGDQLEATSHLERRLIEAENGMREERARMHEIGATVAGIASASHLMRRRYALPWERRQELEQMVESELARLERLMGTRSLVEPHAFRVDHTLEPLVVAHRTQGHPVRWNPMVLQAVGRPDDVAEVVNILLTNAARHGGASGTRLRTHRSTDGMVEIVVTDSGPGVSAALRRRLFEWGTRGPDSRGQGIGLHIAQQLIAEQSGTLELDDSRGPGATFVVRLRAAEDGDRPQ